MAEESVQEPALNEPAVEDNSVTTPPVDEPTTSEPTNDEGAAEQAPINEPAADEPTEDSERKPTRAERRIHQLTDKIEQLKQPNPLFPGQQSPQLPQFDIRQYAQDDGTIDETAVNTAMGQGVVQTAAQLADMMLEEKLAKRDAVSNFQQDMGNVERDYPELSQVPQLEQSIVDEFQARAFRVVGYDANGQPITRIDPSVRLADIAKRHVEGARALAAKSSADMKNAVAMTEDTSAIKPGVEVRNDKPFEELSIEEMEKKLGVVRL